MIPLNKLNKLMLIFIATIFLGSFGFYNRQPISCRIENCQCNLNTSTAIAKSDKVDCNPYEPCVYPEVVDFRVIIITFKRPISLNKLLESLDAVELDGASARMEIWIDRNENGLIHLPTLKLARSFSWSRGPVRVHVQKGHVGIYGQWIDTWAPRDENSSEICVIFEDDISVSPHIYRWLRAGHRYYGHHKDVMGLTLVSDQQNIINTTEVKLIAPRNHTTFMFKSIGTWGVSPRPYHWLKFQQWFHKEARPKPKFRPYVPGVAATVWYKNYEKYGKENTMWSIWLLYYMHKERLYAVYNNIPRYNGDKKSCLSLNRREIGLHNSFKGYENLCELLKVWRDEYTVFPKNTWKLDFDGKPKDKY